VWLETRATALNATLDGDANAAAIAQLARLVQREAFVLAYGNALSILAVTVLFAAVAAMLMRPTSVPGKFF
jgi:DHA2 family multidrug resistance protein